MIVFWRICTCVILLAAVGCGQATKVTEVGEQVTTGDSGSRLPATFGTRSAAATADWMAGVTSQPYSADEPSSLVVVDLGDDSSKVVSGPVLHGSPVTIEALIADGTTFVGVGNVCRGPDGDEGCHGSQQLVRLDPGTESWEFESIPFDDRAQLDGLLKVGNDLLVVESDQGSTVAARYEQNGDWSEIVQLDSPRRPAVCVTNTDLWLFTRNSGRSADPEAIDATFQLTRVDLLSGKNEDIALPELAGYFGGVTTSFGCGESRPFIASTPAGSVPPVDANADTVKDALTGISVYQWTGSGWKAVDVQPVVGHTAPESIISGRIPILLGAEMNGSAGNKPIAVALTGDGGQEIARTGTDAYVWRGTTDDLIRIFDRGPSRQFETVTVRP